MPEVRKNWRIARDRLSDSERMVAELYMRINNWRGAVVRLQGVLKDDPNYTNRDAVYYDLAEIYFKTDNKAQALPWYQKLVDEFTQSEYLEKTQERLKELQAK
jgi:outer membrane protein assembly factor BamD (BamD/ComL family)